MDCNIENSGFCEFLDWDSRFFNIPIGRVIHNRIDSSSILDIFSWCKKNNIRCIYFLCDISENESIRLAEDSGFHLVDLRVSHKISDWILKPEEHSASCIIRKGLPSDAAFLKTIARASYKNTRFYADGNFSQELCGLLYEVWIEKSLNGYANIVFVAEVNNEAAGYITCHLEKELKGRIGLFAVKEGMRGKGIGQSLLHNALNWFSLNKVNRVSVITQGNNISAQDFYQKSGLKVNEIKLWYHRWF